MSDAPLDPSERSRILRDFNATKASYPSDLCLHHLFEEQAARTPAAVAASCGPDSLTYRELSAQANRLAVHLRTLGIGPASAAERQEGGVLIAVICERSLEMIVGLLAALKAGGAYVPIEPDYPRERVGFILSDTRARVLLTQRRLVDHLPAYDGHVVCLDAPETWTDAPEESPRDGQAVPPVVRPEDLAYVMYTSGTTGRPKGVCVQHRGLVNLLHWAWNTHYKAGYLERALFSTSICFDVSVDNLFLPLVSGGTVVVVRNVLALAEPPAPGVPPGFGVTFISCTPSALRSLLDIGCIPPTVRAVQLIGEYLSPALVRELYQLPHIEFVLNAYGPTEATVYSTAVAYRRHAPIPDTIGRPIANTQVYVLDEKLSPVPIGAVGELCIGGLGVAAGYLNRPELSAEKFVPNPFAEDGGGRMYRTGDLARWQEDGSLQYLGRKDLQVKLRGYRIELAEIEAIISQHPAVQQSAVVVAGDQLLAYVTPARVATDELLAFLGSRLPDYMLPARIVPLSSFPMNTQGKVDRRALSADSASVVGAFRFTDPDEQAAADLFQEILGVGPAGPEDDFVQLGGTSLSAARLQARLRQRFAKEVPLAFFFQRLTAPKLARFVRGSGQHFDLWIAFNEGDPEEVPPLIYTHSAGGLSQSARWLAPHLGRRIPVYTFNHPHDRAMSAWPDLEAMAGFYVRALYEKFPRGPYMFVGHSFGVLLAYEMARQLRRDGRAVLFLGMVDEQAEPMPRIPDALLYSVAEEHLLYYDAVAQGCPGVQERYRREMARQSDPKGLKVGGVFLRDVVLMLKQVLRQTILGKDRFLAELSAHYVGTMREYGGDARLGEPDFLIPLLQDLVTTIHLGEQYRRKLGSGIHGKLDVPASLFRAQHLPPRTGTARDKLFYGPPDGGWNRFFSEPIQIVACEGDHVTLQTEPHVRSLGAQMNQSMASALARVGHPAAAALGEPQGRA